VRRWLAALAVVTLGWAASPAAIPVYDGVGVPDDPYRTLTTTPPAAAAQQVLQLGPGTSPALSVRTPETGPQALLDIGPGALKVGPPTSTSTSTTVNGTATVQAAVTVAVTPVPTGTAPTQGSLDSVVYRVTASGATTVSGTAQGFLFLRAAVMTKPDPVIVYRDTPTSPWTTMKTNRAGRDVLSVPFRTFGDYAIIRRPGSTQLSAGGLSGTRLVLIIGGVLILLAITTYTLRRPQDPPG
jgi:hypothetical protein